MPIQDYGAVCDISVLTDQSSLKKAQGFFKNSGLYIPNPTYSWLSRSKLIEVRHQTVKYSLIKQLVEERIIYPTHLPELYDEISRQIMFNTDNNVALTDLRGLLLSAHLQLPILSFDSNLLERISNEIGILTIQKFETATNWLTVRNVLELYRELSYTSGKHFLKELENGKDFSKIIEKIAQTERENIKKIKNSIREINQEHNNSKTLQFHYLAWDITPSIIEYHEESILLPEVLQRVCERCIILVANPPESEYSR